MRVYDRSLETDVIKEQNIWPDDLYHALGIRPEENGAFLDEYLSFVHPEDIRGVMKLLTLSEELGTDTVWEHRVISITGQIRYIYVKDKYDLDADHRPAALLRIFQDVTERKLIEESLKKSEANLRTLFDNSDNGYVLFDTDKNMILCNHLAQKFAVEELGKNLVEGTNALDYFPTERRLFVKDQMNQALRGNKVQYEVSYEQANGSEKFYSVRFFPVLNDDRHVSGIIMALLEITAIKNADKEKEFERNNLLSMINNTNDLIWSVDRDFKLISSNNGFDHLVQLVAGKHIGKGESVMFDAFGKEHLERYTDYYRRAFAGEKFSITDVIDSPEEIWSEISFYPIHKNGEVIGTACYAHDITSRKKFERELEETNKELLAVQARLEYNESRLNQAQAIAHVGSWELPFNGGIPIWSDEAYRIYGVEPGDHRYTFEDWKSFLHPEDLERVMHEVENSQVGFKDSVIYHRIVRCDGTIRHARSESRFELNAEGIPVGLYGIVHDITETQLNEMKLKHSLEMTNRQNKKLQNFAYIVSHNIRSHSANINGLLSVMEESDGQMAKGKSFGMLRTSAIQLEKTIDNLNDIITIQNTEAIEFSSMKLRDETQKAIDTINYMILETKTTVINDIGEKVWVNAIPTYLDSILLNLLTNAVKYRSPDRDPVIRIYSEKGEEGPVLCIEDNGLGIDLVKNGGKIFGMYKTFHNNPDAKGFGLFITKNQVEAMNGRIEVESEEGKGSRFKVHF